MGQGERIRNKQHLEQLLKKYGSCRQVAKALGCTHKVISRLIKKWGIDYTACTGRLPDGTPANGSDRDPVSLYKEEFQTNPENAIKLAVDREKERLAKQYEDQAYRQIIQERARFELIADRIVGAIVRVPEVRLAPYAPEKPSEARLVSLFSDSQIGQEVLAEETGGLAEYNLEIFKRRLHIYGEELCRIGAQHSINRLHLHYLGDIVEGELIYTGQQLHINLLAMEQAVYGIFLIADFMRQLLEWFEEIRCTCVPGNHGRIGKKGQTKKWNGFDYLVYTMLKERLADNPRVSWVISKAFFALDEVCGFGCLMEHGDTIRNWGTFPYYGIDRSDARWSQLLEGKYSFYEVAHHHNPFSVARPSGERIMNGTFVGGSDYSIELKTLNKPAQVAYVVVPGYGRDANYWIQLDR